MIARRLLLLVLVAVRRIVELTDNVLLGTGACVVVASHIGAVRHEFGCGPLAHRARVLLISTALDLLRDAGSCLVTHAAVSAECGLVHLHFLAHHV